MEEYMIKSAEIITLLEKHGWYLYHTKGSHYQFKHPHIRGKVTVPHPKRDLPIGTIRSILRQAGLSKKKIKNK